MAGVRQPLRTSDRASRALEERIALRFPGLLRAVARGLGRLSPHSRLRQAAIRRVVQLAAEAYNRRDLEAVASGFQPDLEYYPYREFVEAGLTEPCYRGPAGYRAYIESTYEVWGRDVRLDLTELIDLGDRVVVLADMPMRAQASGVPLSQKYCSVWTFRDGLVVEVRDFLDQRQALGAAGLDPG
jgi:ketosteroid isomerase-like protein